MSALYAPVLLLHIIVAVLGAGAVASVAVVAGAARRAGRPPSEASAWLGPLLRYGTFSLAAMLLTGVVMDGAAGGAFHQAWWFRLSALMLVATGALQGLARRAVRRAPAGEPDDRVLRRVERLSYVMCALVAAMAVLMKVKPF